MYEQSFYQKYGRLLIGLLVVAFLLLALSSCGGEYRNGLDEISEPPRLTFEECFKGFKNFRAPDKMETRLLTIVCNFLEDHPELEYFHHSDWRAKSAHPLGRALDFHLSDYEGMTDCEKQIQAYDDHQKIMDWMEINGLLKMGYGFYPQRQNPKPGQFNPFCHWDTFGLDAGEKEGRRWAKLNGKYVSFEKGLVWWENRLNYCASL